jgi:hypothetical protein
MVREVGYSMDYVVNEAEELREEGNALFAQGDYAAACAKYEVARPTVCAPRYPQRPRFPRLSCPGRPSLEYA